MSRFSAFTFSITELDKQDFLDLIQYDSIKKIIKHEIIYNGNCYNGRNRDRQETIIEIDKNEYIADVLLYGHINKRYTIKWI
jgi:hypothetical protein